MKHLLKRKENSQKNLLELEKQNQVLKKHISMPRLITKQLDLMNSLIKNICMNSVILLMKLRMHTMRTEECSQNLPGKKPEIKLLLKMSRHTKIRLLNKKLMMRMI
jgi:hypothetical protein